MKTKLLQVIGIVTIAIFAVSCTTAPYYTAPQHYSDASHVASYDSAPYSAPAAQPQLHPNTVPLIATGIAALALYGYAKERSDRKKLQRKLHYNDYHHGHGYHRRGRY